MRYGVWLALLLSLCLVCFLFLFSFSLHPFAWQGIFILHRDGVESSIVNTHAHTSILFFNEKDRCTIWRLAWLDEASTGEVVQLPLQFVQLRGTHTTSVMHCLRSASCSNADAHNGLCSPHNTKGKVNPHACISFYTKVWGINEACYWTDTTCLPFFHLPFAKLSHLQSAV